MEAIILEDLRVGFFAGATPPETVATSRAMLEMAAGRPLRVQSRGIPANTRRRFMAEYGDVFNGDWIDGRGLSMHGRLVARMRAFHVIERGVPAPRVRVSGRPAASNTGVGEMDAALTRRVSVRRRSLPNEWPTSSTSSVSNV